MRGFALHALWALGVSFALSLVFWAVLGIFNAAGFVIWSLVAALVGALLGYSLTRKVVWTVVLTAVVRVLIFVVMTHLLA